MIYELIIGKGFNNLRMRTKITNILIEKNIKYKIKTLTNTMKVDYNNIIIFENKEDLIEIKMKYL